MLSFFGKKNSKGRWRCFRPKFLKAHDRGGWGRRGGTHTYLRSQCSVPPRDHAQRVGRQKGRQKGSQSLPPRRDARHQSVYPLCILCPPCITFTRNSPHLPPPPAPPPSTPTHQHEKEHKHQQALGSTVVTGATDGSVRIWDASAGRQVFLLKTRNMFPGLGLSFWCFWSLFVCACLC